MSNTTTEQWLVVGAGTQRRILQDGEKIMMVQIRFDKGAIGALHNHPHEQMTFVMRGKVRFTLDGKTSDLATGQSIHIPSNVMHGAEALEETELIDVFSPPREDFRQ
jgi:quercetin dioxygenase-like cupin family protein